MFKKGIGGTAVDTVLHVCSLLDCDIYSLTGSGQDADANDRIFFSKYLKLSDSDKELMRLVLEHQLKGYTADNIIEFPVENTLRANTIRIYTNSASAGFGEYIEDSDYIDIDMQEQFPSEADFGVTIHGDSMTPEICDGDVVWVKSEQNVENNDIGVFILNGDSLCKKKIVVGGKIYLRSLNEKYSDIEITEFDDLTVVGKVLGSCPFPN
jgi:phage repressor protein C with HTH and peptisase S24 domain